MVKEKQQCPLRYYLKFCYCKEFVNADEIAKGLSPMVFLHLANLLLA